MIFFYSLFHEQEEGFLNFFSSKRGASNVKSAHKFLQKLSPLLLLARNQKNEREATPRRAWKSIRALFARSIDPLYNIFFIFFRIIYLFTRARASSSSSSHIQTKRDIYYHAHIVHARVLTWKWRSRFQSRYYRVVLVFLFVFSFFVFLFWVMEDFHR